MVVSPVTFKVLLNVAAPVTPSVPPTVVLPDTSNVLFKSVPPATTKLSVMCTVLWKLASIATSKLSFKSAKSLNVVLPVTESVPAVDVLPATSSVPLRFEFPEAYKLSTSVVPTTSRLRPIRRLSLMSVAPFFLITNALLRLPSAAPFPITNNASSAIQFNGSAVPSKVVSAYCPNCTSAKERAFD